MEWRDYKTKTNFLVNIMIGHPSQFTLLNDKKSKLEMEKYIYFTI